jgi:hypothetical protein
MRLKRRNAYPFFAHFITKVGSKEQVSGMHEKWMSDPCSRKGHVILKRCRTLSNPDM